MLIFGIKALIRQSNELNSNFESLHNLLVTEIKQYVNRIEFLSETNLLYNDISIRFNERYNSLMKDMDLVIETKLKNINTLIQEKKYNNAKEEINLLKNNFEDFENAVSSIHQDLLKVIAPEVECKKELNQIKETYELVKHDYEMTKNDTVFLKNSYDVTFKHIDEILSNIAGYIEDANYEDAKASMPEAKEVIAELSNINTSMPEIAHLATKEIPQRIGDLKVEYRHIQVDNCPIFHIFSDHEIADMEDELSSITNDLKLFLYKDKKERLLNLLNKINEKFSLFEKEREAKKTFENIITEVYTNVGETEKSFIRLSNSLPKIKLVYLISEDRNKILMDIKKHIEKLGLTKSGVEKLIHSTVAQPYTLLVNKTNELKNERDKVDSEISEFMNYLGSLKNDVEKAYSSVNLFFYRVKEKEKLIRDVSMDFFDAKYKDKLNEIYKVLDNIYSLTKTTPIDVKAISDCMNFLTYEGDSILNQIEQDFNMMKMAEQAIVFSNSDRCKSPDLNVLIDQDEKMFYDGEFEKAYNDASKNIKNYRE